MSVKYWDDSADYITHFTKPYGDLAAISNFQSILASGTLVANRAFGKKRNAPFVGNAVCFSEKPPDQLDRLVDRRSLYGIGFSKTLAQSKGANPIWYVEKGGDLDRAIDKLIARAEASTHPQSDPIWTLASFIDSAGNYNGQPYRFEWEREWRHLNNFHFKPNEVAFLILPEAEHMITSNFIDEFSDPRQDDYHPQYRCPFIDPMWNKKRIIEALNEV